MRNWWKTHYKKLSIFSIISCLLLISSCDGQDVGQISHGKSSAGNYLAAKYAYSNNDYDKAIYYFNKSLAQDQNNTNIIKQLYGVNLIIGNYDKAMDLVRKHNSLSPDDLFTRFLLNIDHFKNERFSKASDAYDSLPTERSFELKTIIIPSMMVWSGVARKDYARSLKLLESISLGGGDHTEFNLYQQAIILELSGKTEIAKDVFDELSSAPSTYQVTKYAVDFYRRNGFEEEANQAIKKFYEYSNKIFITTLEDTGFNSTTDEALDARKISQQIMANILTEVGTSFLQTMRLEEAIIYYQLALNIDDSDDRISVLLASALEKKGLYKPALKIYSSIDKNSRFRKMIQQDIALLYNKMAKDDQAKAMLVTFSKDNPKRIDVLLNLGDLLVAQKNFAQAIQYYENAITIIRSENEGQIIKKHWPILYALAICYEQDMQWEKAEKTFLQALEVVPEQPDVMNYLAYSWLTQNVKLVQAEAMLRIAVTKKPKDAHILDSYGWALYKLGNYEDALFFVEQANARIPYDPTTNDHLGDIYWQVGRENEAVFMWKRALTFKPKAEDIVKIKLKIKYGYQDKKQTIGSPKMVKSQYIMSD